MGKPGYEVLGGSVTLDGVDVLALPAWERAAAGLHLVMQYPTEVPGVALDDVLREALAARGGRSTTSTTVLARRGARASASTSASSHRPLNVDLSGGEKKRNETLQLAVLRAEDRHPRRARLRPRHRRPARLRPAHRGADRAGDGGPASACWRSPTTTGCSPSCAPTACTSWSKGRIVADGRPRAGRPARGRGLRGVRRCRRRAEPRRPTRSTTCSARETEVVENPVTSDGDWSEDRWTESGGCLRRRFRFADFSEAFGFMTRVALLAENRGSPPRLVELVEHGRDLAHHPLGAARRSPPRTATWPRPSTPCCA